MWRRIFTVVISFIPFALGIIGVLFLPQPPVGVPSMQPPPTADANSGLLLIARDAVPHSVVATDRYLFYVRSQSEVYPLYGYDLQEKREFLVTQEGGYKFPLAAGGNRLVWSDGDVESPSGARLMSYSLETGEIVQLAHSTTFDLKEGWLASGNIDLDGDMLYYVGRVNNPEPTFGIMSRNLVTGAETFLIPGGRDPQADGGNLLWTKEIPDCSDWGSKGVICMYSVELYLRKQGQTSDTLLAEASGQGAFQSPGRYDIIGNTVVWAATDGPSSIVNIESGATTVPPNVPMAYPIIWGDKVAWVGGETRDTRDTLYVYSTATGQTTRVYSSTFKRSDHTNLPKSIPTSVTTTTYPGNEELYTHALIGESAIALTLGTDWTRSLYVIELER